MIQAHRNDDAIEHEKAAAAAREPRFNSISIERLIVESVVATNVSKRVLCQLWPRAAHNVDVHQGSAPRPAASSAAYQREKYSKFSRPSQAWISSWSWPTGGTSSLAREERKVVSASKSPALDVDLENVNERVSGEVHA